MKLTIKISLLASFFITFLLLGLLTPPNAYADAECQPGETQVCDNMGTCSNGNVCATGNKYCVWEEDGNHHWGQCSKEVDNCGEASCQNTATPPSSDQPPACDDEARYCDTNVGKKIYKHDGWFDQNTQQCDYLWTEEDECDPRDLAGICVGRGGRTLGPASQVCKSNKIIYYYTCNEGGTENHPSNEPCNLTGPCSDHDGGTVTSSACNKGKRVDHYTCSDNYGDDVQTDQPCGESQPNNPPQNPSGKISANPNPCTKFNDKGVCTSKIAFSTSNTSKAVVCVSDNGGKETVFASGTNGSQDATWIQTGHSYAFNLKTFEGDSANCNGQILSTVKVAGSNTSPLPPAKNLQATCSDDGTVKISWDAIPDSTAYVLRTNAFPDGKDDGWHPADLGVYTGTTHVAPNTKDNKDFGANTRGNSSTTYKAKIVPGVKYSTSIQGVRQGEAYPYKGQHVGVDFTCNGGDKDDELSCGGIEGKTCPKGYECKLEATGPDINGKCIPLPATPSAELEYTTKYQLAYDSKPTTEAEWGQEYVYQDNIKAKHTFFSELGDKFVFVKFKTNKGRESIHQLKVALIATPSSNLPAAKNLQATCSADGTVKISWDAIPDSTAYTLRTNAFPDGKDNGWGPVDLGTYTGTTHIAPTTGTQDFGANTRGNTSTVYKAKIVGGMKYNLSVQGIKEGEKYPFKGEYAGVDFTCGGTSPLPAAKNLQAVCLEDGTVKISWDSIAESTAYVVRTNAFPDGKDDNWHPADLGPYTGTTLAAPSEENKDFTTNTRGNASTTVMAKVVSGMKYNTSIQGVREGEKYPYKGAYAGADFTCNSTTSTSSTAPSSKISVALTGPGEGSINQKVDFNAQAWGQNLTNMQIYAAKTTANLSSASSWTLIGENKSCQGNNCLTQGPFTPAEAASYYIVVNVKNSEEQCSGNPLLLQQNLRGWTNCGLSSRMTFTVQ